MAPKPDKPFKPPFGYFAHAGRPRRVIGTCLGPCSVEGCDRVSRYWFLADGVTIRECPHHDRPAVDRQVAIKRRGRKGNPS